MSSEQDQLIDKYLEGNCTPEELKQLQDWLQLHELAEDALPSAASHIPDDVQSRRMYTRIMQSIVAPAQAPGKAAQPSWIRQAAAVLAGIALLSSLYLLQRDNRQVANATAHVVRNTSDTVVRVHLPDGSDVWLNRQAQLSWDEKEFVTARNARLSGEAYFEVAHDAAHPFTVHAGNTRTTVLGTTFSIRSTEESAPVTVMLFTGKVRVAAGNAKPRILLPGEAVICNPEAEQIENTAIPFHALAWKNKEFSCNNASLENVVRYLSEYYQVPISLDNAYCKLKCSGRISLRETLPAVLEQLLFVHQLHYRKTEGRIVIF